MDNNQDEHLDKQAGVEFKPLPTETLKPKSAHPKQNPDAPVVKASSPCKETENTNRIASSPESAKSTGEETATTDESRYGISSSTESTKGTEKETATNNESRVSPWLRSTTETDEETPTTNKSSNGISSPPESTKGSEEDTATTNDPRFNRAKIDEDLRTKVKEISSRKGRGWSPNDLEVFKHPMCLTSVEHETNEDGEENIVLKSEKEVFEQIKQIDMPMVVVAVAGLYRTGKSYLMNRLAESSKGGFEMGNTVEPKTEGIWIWCRMHPKQRDTVLVLLDTEGLGSVEKGNQNYDNNLFTLATLLCNCLVYNMKGAVDNEALSKLTFVTEMAKNIRYRGTSSVDNNMLKLILPDFVLCVRDFTLELEKDGKTISANEYLENSLAEKKGKAAQFNKQRSCIKKYFPKRECFVFPMPGDTPVIKNLANSSFDDLCDSFKDAIRIFASYIYDIPPKDMSGSKPINGEMFVTLVERYVEEIRLGRGADVDDAFQAAASIENAKIKTVALEIFENHIGKLELPVSEKVLTFHYTKAQQAALGYLRGNVVHDLKDECESQAQRKMDEFWVDTKKDNDTRVQEMCEKTLQDNDLMRNIKEKIENKDYETAGGYPVFQLDVKRLRGDYVNVLSDFDKNKTLRTWIRFINSIEETEARILEADITLSKKDKEDEQRRNQENIEKKLKEQQKAQQEALVKQKKDLTDHYKKLAEDREKKVKADRAKYEVFVNEKLDKETAHKELLEREKQERKERWFPARMWNAFWNDD